MKAAVLYSPGKIRVEEVEAPTPGPGEAVVRVRAVGVCPTDLRKYVGLIRPPTPIILGHEVSGEIVDIRDEGHGLRRGDRVVINPFIYCYKCRYCRLGRYNLCLNLGGIGGVAEHGRRLDGAFAEYVKAPVKNLYRVNPAVPFESAALTEPLAACLNSLRRCGVREGSTIAIMGAGPMGLMHLQLSKLFGAATIIVSEPLAHRREKALELGATYVIDPKREDPIRRVRQLTDGLGVDVVVVATGGEAEAACVMEAMRMVARGGVVNVFAGTWPPAQVTLNPNLIHYNEVSLIGSYLSTPEIFSEALRLITSGRVDPGRIVSDIYPLNEIEKAFQRAISREALKVEVKP